MVKRILLWLARVGRRSGAGFRALCGATAVLIACGNLFLHKPVSDVCDALSARLGFPLYNRLALAAISGGFATLLALPLVAGLRRGRLAARRGAVALILLGASSVVAQRWLLVANVELIHFPQYAILAVLSGLAGASPAAAWVLASGAGVLDEVYQYLVVYAERPEAYLDFNDMLLNAIGAAWGVLVLLALGRRRGPAAFCLPFAIGGLLLLPAAWIDPPRLDPLLTVARTGRPYRVLSLPEALAGCLSVLAILVFADGPRRRAVATAATAGSSADGRES